MFEYELLKDASGKANSKMQTIVIMFVALLGLILLIWIVSKLVKAIKSDDAVKESKNDLNKKNLSYNDSWYEQKASGLQYAMQGIGTDEELIYRTLNQLKNNDDWLKLFVVFGTKDGKNLTEWLVDDLDSSELVKVNSILNKIGASI